MFKHMEPKGIVDIRQGSNSEINGYIQIDISVVCVANH